MTEMVTDKDQALIALLRTNAREPVTVLARKLGLSRTTVQDRIKRLEASGVIKGYRVELADASPQQGISAFVTISVEPRRAGEVARELKLLPQVDSLHTVSGKFDLVAVVRTASTAEMDAMLDKIGTVPGVTRTESAIILSTRFKR